MQKDPFRSISRFWCHNSCHHLPPGFSSIQRVLRCRCGRGWTGLLVLSATIDLSGDGTGCLDGALSVCLWSWNICASSSSEWALDPVTVDVQWVGALKRKHLSLLSSTFNVHATLVFTQLPFAHYGFMMLHVGINRYLMASTAFRSQHTCADLETHAQIKKAVKKHFSCSSKRGQLATSILLGLHSSSLHQWPELHSPRSIVSTMQSCWTPDAFSRCPQAEPYITL